MRIFPGNLPPAGAPSMPSSEYGQERPGGSRRPAGDGSWRADKGRRILRSGLGLSDRRWQRGRSRRGCCRARGRSAADRRCRRGAGCCREAVAPPSSRRQRGQACGRRRSRKAGDRSAKARKPAAKASYRAEPQPLRTLLARVNRDSGGAAFAWRRPLLVPPFISTSLRPGVGGSRVDPGRRAALRRQRRARRSVEPLRGGLRPPRHHARPRLAERGLRSVDEVELCRTSGRKRCCAWGSTTRSASGTGTRLPN